jgi:BolA protein
MTVQERIRERLLAAFEPEHLELDNESHMHSVPRDSETHFRVLLVSERFAGKRPVARHQLVYAALAEELAGPVHALALHTYDPAEWTQRDGGPASPACLGGSKTEAEGL